MRSKGKGKGIRARDHTLSRAPKFPLPLSTQATQANTSPLDPVIRLPSTRGLRASSRFGVVLRSHASFARHKWRPCYQVSPHVSSPEWKFLNALYIRKGVDAKSGYFFYPVTLQDRAQFFTVNIQDGAERNIIVSLLLGLQFQVL